MILLFGLGTPRVMLYVPCRLSEAEVEICPRPGMREGFNSVFIIIVVVVKVKDEGGRGE